VRRLLAPILALCLVLAACDRLVERPQQTAEATPTPLPTPAESGKPVGMAKRGSITEVVKGNGRVQAVEETTLYFKQGGRLKRLYVELNQKVKKGDKIAELDTPDLATQIAQARIKLDIAQLGMEQAIKKASLADPAVRTSAAKIQTAEASRAQAVAVLQKLHTGVTHADVQAAEATVAAAEAQLEKANAEVASLQRPKSADETAAARASLDKAQSVVQQAQAAYDKVASRPDVAGRPEAVALQQATADYQAAQARYKLATAGPRPEEVTAAQQGVESAKAALDGAVARREQVKGGPQTTDLSSAQASVTAANANVEAARADYEAKLISSGNSTANFDVEVAQKGVEIAGLEVKRLEEQLSGSQLIAPYDGIVTSTSGREGDLVNAYAPVAVVANPTKLVIAMDLNAPDLPKAAVGQVATVTLDAYRGQRLEGKVIALPSVASGISPSAAVPG
jgi:multidrug resistance efflux pump